MTNYCHGCGLQIPATRRFCVMCTDSVRRPWLPTELEIIAGRIALAIVVLLLIGAMCHGN